MKTVETEVRVPIRSDGDVVNARQQGRSVAAQLGFSGSDLTIIATAISEMARNIVSYAGEGEIILGPAHQGAKQGILVIAKDQGPGIPNVAQAMQDGFSTGNSLGLGLPGTKRLMDEFEIVSEIGKGTTVTMKKWRR
ncbi:MAG TPA: anti-sigma regulatory factor [Acidobacteriota bacterium]|jgi:serine/threonine-protein kinase RsbT